MWDHPLTVGICLKNSCLTSSWRAAWPFTPRLETSSVDNKFSVSQNSQVNNQQKRRRNKKMSSIEAGAAIIYYKGSSGRHVPDSLLHYRCGQCFVFFPVPWRWTSSSVTSKASRTRRGCSDATKLAGQPRSGVPTASRSEFNPHHLLSRLTWVDAGRPQADC